MGVVYKAHDTLLEREVALKIIGTSIEANPELRERFFREARAAGQLSHRNVITIHDLGEHDGQPYLAMEYLSGEDLQHRLARQEPMSLWRKLEVATQICEGLSYAHRRGLVHRDVKPANIFITDEGVVKLLDFGLARMVASELTRSNMMMGTLNYMAPEQVRGERTDHRADIFSFGVVLYEMLSGKKAFQGDSFATTLYKILQDVPEPLHSIDPTLPQELVWLVETTLAKPKDERYQDLGDVTRDLAVIRQHLSGVDVATAPLPLGSPRVPSDPPRSTDASGRPPSGGRPASGGRPPSGGRPASGGRPSSGPARAASMTTTFAATPAPADTVPPAARPAPRYWTFAGGALALVAVTSIAAWIALRPTGGPSSETPAAAVSSPPSSTASAPAPAPTTAPVTPAPAVQPEPDGKPTAETVRAQVRDADEARQRMARAKASARQAGSGATGSAAFAAAAAAEREGNRLLASKQHSEAAAKFYEATGLFRSAELATPPPVTAPAQSPPPPRSTQPAGQAAPPPATPPVQTSAPSLPAPETPVQLPPAPAPRPNPAPPPPQTAKPPVTTAAEGEKSPASSETAIRELLRRYQRAMESRNIDALKAIWPTLQGAQEDAVRREFQFARRIALEIDSLDVKATGATGTAFFTRRYQIVTTDNQKLDRTSRTTMTLRRQGDDWIIDSVRFEPIR
jgi:serine/threonine-protein kinase